MHAQIPADWHRSPHTLPGISASWEEWTGWPVCVPPGLPTADVWLKWQLLSILHKQRQHMLLLWFHLLWIIWCSVEHMLKMILKEFRYAFCLFWRGFSSFLCFWWLMWAGLHRRILYYSYHKIIPNTQRRAVPLPRGMRYLLLPQGK